MNKTYPFLRYLSAYMNKNSYNSYDIRQLCSWMSHTKQRNTYYPRTTKRDNTGCAQMGQHKWICPVQNMHEMLETFEWRANLDLRTDLQGGRSR